MYSGGVSYMLPTSDYFTFDFTMVEIYGGAHLVLDGNGTKLSAVKVIGDYTGHFHIPPFTTFELVEVSYRFHSKERVLN